MTRCFDNSACRRYHLIYNICTGLCIHTSKGSHKERVSNAIFFRVTSLKLHQKARVNTKVIVLKIGFVAFCCTLKQALDSEVQQVLPRTLLFFTSLSCSARALAACSKLFAQGPLLLLSSLFCRSSSSTSPSLQISLVTTFSRSVFPPRELSPSRAFAQSFLRETISSQNQTAVHHSWKGQLEIRIQQLP